MYLDIYYTWIWSYVFIPMVVVWVWSMFFSSQVFWLVVLSQVPWEQKLRWGFTNRWFVGRSRQRWDREEEKATQGQDFRERPCLSISPWGAPGSVSDIAGFVLPLHTKELGFRALPSVSHWQAADRQKYSPAFLLLMRQLMYPKTVLWQGLRSH